MLASEPTLDPISRSTIYRLLRYTADDVNVKLKSAGCLPNPGALATWREDSDALHPDSHFEYFVQILHKRIENNVRRRIVVHRQLLAVSVATLEVIDTFFDRENSRLELDVQDFHVEIVLNRLILTAALRLGL